MTEDKEKNTTISDLSTTVQDRKAISPIPFLVEIA